MKKFENVYRYENSCKPLLFFVSYIFQGIFLTNVSEITTSTNGNTLWQYFALTIPLHACYFQCLPVDHHRYRRFSEQVFPKGTDFLKRMAWLPFKLSLCSRRKTVFRQRNLSISGITTRNLKRSSISKYQAQNVHVFIFKKM